MRILTNQLYWLRIILLLLVSANVNSAYAQAQAQPVTTPVVKAGLSIPEIAVPELMLVLGEIKLIPVIGKVSRIALGNGGFVSATTVDSNVMLIGEQPGITTLMVWAGKDVLRYQIRVVQRDLAESRRFLESLLREGDRAQISEVNAKLIISGTLQRATYKQLQTMASQMPEVVLNAKEDLSSPFVRSLIFRLHFVEIKNDWLEKLGIQWSQSAPGPIFGAQSIASNQGIFSNIPPAQQGDNLLDPGRPFLSVAGRTSGLFLGLASTIASRINLGISTGDVRILASPELSTKSGGEAKLQVGGEIPIPQAGAFGATTVIFKPYGINFEIQPHLSDEGIITAKLATELSQIDPAVTISGIPGFLNRKTSTDISVKAGEMIALSGLISSELSTAIDKVPGLGSIPILGRLFRSDDFRNRKSDLVVLLEPDIVMSGGGLAAEIRERGIQYINQHKEKLEDFSKPKKLPLKPREDESLLKY